MIFEIQCWWLRGFMVLNATFNNISVISWHVFGEGNRSTRRKLCWWLIKINMFIYSVYRLFLDKRMFLRADRNKCWESTGKIRVPVKANPSMYIGIKSAEKIGRFLKKKMSGKVCVYQYFRNAYIRNTPTHHYSLLSRATNKNDFISKKKLTNKE